MISYADSHSVVQQLLKYRKVLGDKSFVWHLIWHWLEVQSTSVARDFSSFISVEDEVETCKGALTSKHVTTLT